MNNNTRTRLSHLGPGQTHTFAIPCKIQGNHGSDYSTRYQTILRLAQPRKSHRPKVAAAR